MASFATAVSCVGDHLLGRLELAVHRGPHGSMLIAGAAQWSDYLEIGGISATHLAAFEIARSLGCKSVDLRFCRPSPADGLFQVKRAWGGDFVDNRTDAHDYDFLVGWSRTTPAVLRFLSATPLIVRHRCGYAALVADRCSLARLRTPPGIAGFIVPVAGRGFADRVLLPPSAARHSPG